MILILKMFVSNKQIVSCIRIIKIINKSICSTLFQNHICCLYCTDGEVYSYKYKTSCNSTDDEGGALPKYDQEEHAGS